MAHQLCLRCFGRLSLSPAAHSTLGVRRSVTAGSARSFSSSTSLARDGKTRTLRLRRSKRTKGYKVPAIGERKTLRKRVILSNSNALPVQNLSDFPQSAASDHQSLVGKVVALPDATVDGLRSLESFRPGQSWSMFNRPCTLFSQRTFDLVKAIETSDRSSVYRRIITGPRGCGKSVFLLQAHTAALQQGWVVIHIPEGIALTNATTAYAPIPKTSPIQYSQPKYTAELLSRIAAANQQVLSKMSVLLSHSDLITSLAPRGTSLLKLAESGAADVENAWPIFEALWAELTISNGSDTLKSASQTADVPAGKASTKSKGASDRASNAKDENRPRILLTLDGVAPVSRQSSYLAPDMHHIHAFDLSLVNHFMSHLSGKAELPNGGAVLAADSLGTRAPTPTLDLAVRQAEEIHGSADSPIRNPSNARPPLYDLEAPFERHDERVLSTLREVPVISLPGFSRTEAQAMLEYYAMSGMLRARITDALVAEKWAVSGGGIIRELERASVGSGLL